MQTGGGWVGSSGSGVSGARSTAASWSFFSFCVPQVQECAELRCWDHNRLNRLNWHEEGPWLMTYEAAKTGSLLLLRSWFVEISTERSNCCRKTLLDLKEFSMYGWAVAELSDFDGRCNMFDSFVLFCWGFFAFKSWPLQENGTKIDLVFAVGRFCPDASAYEDFRSQSLRKMESKPRNSKKSIGIHAETQKLPIISVILCSFSVHFLSFSPNFLSFRKANVRRLNWLRRCISLTLLQRTNVDVYLSCYVATKVSLMLEECHSVRESSCRTGKT